jgi:hypothetical protein
MLLLLLLLLLLLSCPNVLQSDCNVNMHTMVISLVKTLAQNNIPKPSKYRLQIVTLHSWLS